MTKRRQSKEEVAEELLGGGSDQSREDLPEPTDDSGSPSTETSASSAADEAGTFTALDDAELEEINEMFRLLHDNGYMTAGQYSVVGDGSGNITIALTVMPPSSGGLPEDAFGEDGSAEGHDDA